LLNRNITCGRLSMFPPSGAIHSSPSETSIARHT
jgi:hypothetical protein